jgi:tRNA/tmRNA/rRNA uracil-C5-methylase (TrmA/RlmC/RlmD family)
MSLVSVSRRLFSGRALRFSFARLGDVFHDVEITKITDVGEGLCELPPSHCQRYDPVSKSLKPLAITEAVTSSPGLTGLVPGAILGERVRVQVRQFLNPQMPALDLLEVVDASKAAHRRAEPRCAQFGRCGGCQLQHLAYDDQIAFKTGQLTALLGHFGVAVEAVKNPSPYAYRSKISPHYRRPEFTEAARKALGRAERPQFQGDEIFEASVGRDDLLRLPYRFNSREHELDPLRFDMAGRYELRRAARMPPVGYFPRGAFKTVVDVPRCEIALPAVNEALARARDEIRAKEAKLTSDLEAGVVKVAPQASVSLVFRAGDDGKVVGQGAQVTETVRGPGFGRDGEVVFKFRSDDFFQNTPGLLPALVSHVVAEAKAGGAVANLVDVYCGSGLFALCGSSSFARVFGLEISASSVIAAQATAKRHGIQNCTFRAANADTILTMSGLPPAAATTVVMDPPRTGATQVFLDQLISYRPKRVVYVSCEPKSQARDIEVLKQYYDIKRVVLFDMFPQTYHTESVVTLESRGPK